MPALLSASQRARSSVPTAPNSRQAARSAFPLPNAVSGAASTPAPTSPREGFTQPAPSHNRSATSARAGPRLLWQLLHRSRHPLDPPTTATAPAPEGSAEGPHAHFPSRTSSGLSHMHALLAAKPQETFFPQASGSSLLKGVRLGEEEEQGMDEEEEAGKTSLSVRARTLSVQAHASHGPPHLPLVQPLTPMESPCEALAEEPAKHTLLFQFASVGPSRSCRGAPTVPACTPLGCPLNETHRAAGVLWNRTPCSPTSPSSVSVCSCLAGNSSSDPMHFTRGHDSRSSDGGVDQVRQGFASQDGQPDLPEVTDVLRGPCGEGLDGCGREKTYEKDEDGGDRNEREAASVPGELWPCLSGAFSVMAT